MEKKKNDNQKTKQQNNSHSNKVTLCILIVVILTVELLVSYYLQTTIINEVENRFVSKRDINDIFVHLMKQEQVKSEIKLLIRKFEESAKLDKLTRRKRGALAVDDNLVTGGTKDHHVEFFNPKLRHELESKDEVERARTGSKGAAPGGDAWVWLTSYSRIPMMAIQGFCSATRDYCPPGPPGPSGPLGQSGPKGERGDVGLPGIPGPAGNRGPKGPPGERGWPGSQGLDGRDGVPGEPGLDGVPGRNGLDGIPGINGMPGNDGRPGRDGTNGTDGKPGLSGPQGPPGPTGPKGLTGPRGRSGKSGTPGTHGIPGICAYQVKGNGTSDLLIPPSIAGSKTVLGNRPIVVHEGENVRMRCAATGNPKPEVEWRKADGSAIPLGSWQTVSVHGYILNLTKVNRNHMGIYQCVADNGIPPSANATFQLEVHFSPLIRIRNQMVGASNGSSATLECEVEAFPEAVMYWERADGRLLEHSVYSKFLVNNTSFRYSYKSLMQLRILNINMHDYSQYHCIAKNERGITKGVFTVYERDPRLATPPPVIVGGGVAVYGVPPPESKTLEDLCPPPVVCPDCPDPREFKCRDSGISIFDLVGRLDIRPFGNTTYAGIPNRAFDCVLYAVGKPVYHRFTDQNYGCWMRDPAPSPKDSSEKFWVTKEDDSYHLYEFESKTYYRKDTPTKTYNLTYPFVGNSHVVYNNSFYYNARNKPWVVKLDLGADRYQHLEAPLVATNGSNYLYTTQHNYMDFSVDDNGLWIIYSMTTNNNTVVMKVDENAMTIQYAWNISINHRRVGEMFIVCGVLYAVDNVTARDTRIRLALDLYKNRLLDVNLPFTNPFRRTTMLGYNHKNKELYTWDKGNQLTYPIRYHEIGYSLTKEEKAEAEEAANAQMQTGSDVYNK